MFCIWCGQPVEGEVVLHCSACNRTNFLNSKISGGTLTVHDGHYLTVKRAAPPEQGKWDLPGGFCDYGEHPAAAAVRETLEETGIQVTVRRLLGVVMDRYREPDGRYWPTANLFYLATPDTLTSEPTTIDRNETADLAWHPLDDPPAEIAFPEQLHAAISAYHEPRP